jgi:signal transduction histidine kinase
VGITQDAKGSGLVGPLMAAGVSAGIGAAVRAQRQLDERLAITERAVLEQTRTLQRLAVDRERRRLAEAHHATVARQVEDLVSATEAARRLLVDDDERFAQAVVEVERGGRDALTTMRDVLGSLRADDLPGPGPSETHLEARALDRATA